MIYEMDLSLLRSGIGYSSVFLLGSGVYYSFPKVIPPSNLKKSINEIVLGICGSPLEDWRTETTPSGKKNDKQHSYTEWMVCRNKLYCENIGKRCDQNKGYEDFEREEWEYTDFDSYGN